MGGGILSLVEKNSLNWLRCFTLDVMGNFETCPSRLNKSSTGLSVLVGNNERGFQKVSYSDKLRYFYSRDVL